LKQSFKSKIITIHESTKIIFKISSVNKITAPPKNKTQIFSFVQYLQNFTTLGTLKKNIMRKHSMKQEENSIRRQLFYFSDWLEGQHGTASCSSGIIKSCSSIQWKSDRVKPPEEWGKNPINWEKSTGTKHNDCEESKGRNPHFFKNGFSVIWVDYHIPHLLIILKKKIHPYIFH